MDAGAVRKSQVLGRREVADRESLGGAGQGRVDRHAGGIQHLGQPMERLAVAAEGDPARAAGLQHDAQIEDVPHGNAPHPAGLIAAQPVQVQPPLPDQLVVHPAGVALQPAEEALDLPVMLEIGEGEPRLRLDGRDHLRGQRQGPVGAVEEHPLEDPAAVSHGEAVEEGAWRRDGLDDLHTEEPEGPPLERRQERQAPLQPGHEPHEPVARPDVLDLLLQPGRVAGVEMIGDHGLDGFTGLRHGVGREAAQHGPELFLAAQDHQGRGAVQDARAAPEGPFKKHRHE